MRALILFTTASIDKGQAHPEELKHLLEANATSPLTVDVATYDQLSYVLTKNTQLITVHSSGLSLDDYDVVYLRRIKESIAQAIAVGKYCLAKGIAVMDHEIAHRPGSMGKLTQYLQFSLAGIPFPDTVYSSDHALLLQALDSYTMSYPLILKSVSGSRGSDNYLVASRSELEGRLQDQPEVHFLIQAYVPNQADYRVWVCGDQVGPVLYRSRSDGHMNNTSQGGNAELLAAEALPSTVIDECIRASRILDRDIAGVDVVFDNDDLTASFYFFEVNRAPQIEGTPFEEVKAAALAQYMAQCAQAAS